MMSVKIKIQLSKKSLAKLSSILLVFLLFFSIFLVKTNSQSDETSNYFGYVLLVFSIVVIALAILAVTNTPIADFLLKNYKKMIIAFIILFLLIYFIPQIPFKSITGLFVISPTTTITTTISEVKEEALPGLVQTFSEVQPGKINSMKVSGKGVDLTEINLEVYRTINNVRIMVSRLVSKPSSTMQDPPGNVYQYLEIEKTNIKDEDLKRVTIEFRVGKSWINDNGIDESTISLNRYQDNVWVRLSTAKTGEDDVFSYYETYTATLSLFAITGSSEPLAETTTTTTVTTTTSPIAPLDVTTSPPAPLGATTTISPYDCDDADTECTLTTFTKTYLDGSAMTFNYQRPVNYLDEDGTYQKINKTIVQLPTDHPVYGYGYRYGTEKGIYKVYFKPNISQKWEIGLNVSNRILRYDFQEVGYYDYSDDRYKTIPRSPSTKDVILNDNLLNYTEVFPGMDIQYEYLSQKLKEKIFLNETFNDSLPDPRIPYFDMNPRKTYLVFGSEFNYTDLTPYVNDTEQTGNFTVEDKIEFRDTLGNVKFFLPVGYAVDSQVNDLGIPNNTQKVKWRLKHHSGKHYLLYGIPVLWLASAQYPVVIDPTGEIPFSEEIEYYGLYNDLNDYYFNATNAMQMVNHFQDYWSHNKICMGFYIGKWREYCSNKVDWTWYNSTDYSSYVNLTGVAEAFYGKDWYQRTTKYGVRVTLEHYLTSDSPEIRVSVKLENIGQNDISDTYIKILTHDIRVNATSEDDTFRINTTSFWESWSDYNEYWLNESLDLVYTQDDLISRKFAVYDNSTESWVELEWNDSYWRNGVSYSMNYNVSVDKGSGYNAPVDLRLFTGVLNKNDVVSTNFRWADAVRQNITLSEELYNQTANTKKALQLDSYYNGIELYWYDTDMKIELMPDNILYYEETNVLNNSVNENVWNFLSFIMKDYLDCPKVNNFVIEDCPDVESIRKCNEIWSASEYRSRSTPDEGPWAVLAPFNVIDSSTYYRQLLLDNKSGELKTLNGSFLPSTIDQKDLLNRWGRVNLPAIFNLHDYSWTMKAELYHEDLSGTSHCINFTLPQNTRININVTMLSPISNYTFGRPEFIENNYTDGNSAIAKIKPYPCCGVHNVPIQVFQVCSE